MLVGQREPTTGLWVLPIAPTTPPPYTTPDTDVDILNPPHHANHAYQITPKSELIKFLHQCAFSPPVSTWTKAIDNNHF